MRVSLVAGSLALPQPSHALDFMGASSTYVPSRQAADGAKLLGAYEYLDAAMQGIGSETVSFHTGGWFRADLPLREADLGRRSNEDLQYAYLSLKRPTANLTLNVGRVMVFDGGSAERLDGLYARTDLLAGFGISTFAGNSVETGTDLQGNSWIYGARLSHQALDRYRIGVSALKEDKDVAPRKQAAIDAWVHPMRWVDLTGRSTYDAISSGWMEHAYAASLGPFWRLRLSAKGSWIDYDSYFRGANIDAFAIRTGVIEPHERVLDLGSEAVFSITDTISAAGDYRKLQYRIAGPASSYGGRILLAASGAGGAGIAFHRMDGDASRLRYREYRVYGYKTFGKLEITADVFDLFYDVARNGVHNAVSAVLGAGYRPTESLKIFADLEYLRNPDFDKDLRTFVKLLYRFGAGGGA